MSCAVDDDDAVPYGITAVSVRYVMQTLSPFLSRFDGSVETQGSRARSSRLFLPTFSSDSLTSALFVALSSISRGGLSC